MGLGKVTDASLDPADAAGAATAGATSFTAGSAGAGDDLPAPPLPLGDGSFGLVVREAARRSAEAAGGVAPADDDLPEVEDSDRGFS